MDELDCPELRDAQAARQSQTPLRRKGQLSYGRDPGIVETTGAWSREC